MRLGDKFLQCLHYYLVRRNVTTGWLETDDFLGRRLDSEVTEGLRRVSH